MNVLKDVNSSGFSLPHEVTIGNVSVCVGPGNGPTMDIVSTGVIKLGFQAYKKTNACFNQLLNLW